MDYSNNISFGSSHIRVTKVINALTGKAENAIFSKLDFNDPEDIVAIKSLKKKWLNKQNFNLCSLFKEFADSFLNEKFSHDSFYALEKYDNSLPLEKKILGVVKVFNNGGTKRIDYIQVAPEAHKESPSRQYKDVGTSLMNNVLKTIQRAKAKQMTMLSMQDPFFDRIGIPVTKQYGGCSDRILPQRDFSRVIANTNIMQ